MIRCGNYDPVDVVGVIGEFLPDVLAARQASCHDRSCRDDLVREELPPQQAGMIADLGEDPLKGLAALIGGLVCEGKGST